MELEDNLLSEIFKDTLFTNAETSLILSKLKKITLKKGALLLSSNQPVLKQYFIINGCLRTFFLDSSGKEHTIQFAINDWWISDYTAFFTSTNAQMTIECIQDANLYEISKKDIDILFLKVPKLETFFRKKMEKAFSSFQKRILSSLSQSAKERYVTFIRTYPNIEKTVKNYHIASYLGITTESLSRIRKELTKT